MAKAWLASGAMIAFLVSSALPLSAQVVVGESEPYKEVDVNWDVLNRLGTPPTLADLLKQPSGSKAIDYRTAQAVNEAEKNVMYHKLGSDPQQPVYHSLKSTTQPSEIPAPPKTHKVIEEAALPTAPAKSVATAPVPVTHPAPMTLPSPAPELAKAPPITTPTPTPTKIAAPTPAPPAPVTPAPAPVAPAVAVAPPPEQPQQVAALMPTQPPLDTTAPKSSVPSDGIIRKGDIVTMLFKAEANQLPSGAQSALTQLVQRLSKDESLGVQLMAYAAGDASSVSQARRLSLSRALEVRKVLLDLGIRSTRIEIRALGNKQDGNDPLDRVDVLVVSH